MKKHRILMFHYVKPTKESSKYPNLNFFPLDQFCNFLDEYLERLKLVSPDQFIHAIEKKIRIPENALLLSFDDGLGDHYKWVFPELMSRGLSAFFFINTLPILERQMLTVHKIHALSGLLGYDELRPRFLKLTDKNINNEYSKIDESKILNAYPYDSLQTAKFKYLLNHQMPQDTINPILDILLIEFFGTTFLKEFYLEKENIKIMDKSGMTFGYHGHSHTPFSMLNKNELGNEIAIEKQFFSSIGVYAKSISHPYGDAASVNNENLEVIHKNHIKLGFMAEDFEYNSDLQMGRIDCKEILDNNFY
jgi:peptidoglycan/xylan/chitin deacetylase (PgdA/CDA1 family)